MNNQKILTVKTGWIWTFIRIGIPNSVTTILRHFSLFCMISSWGLRRLWVDKTETNGKICKLCKVWKRLFTTNIFIRLFFGVGKSVKREKRICRLYTFYKFSLHFISLDWSFLLKFIFALYLNCLYLSNKG